MAKRGSPEWRQNIARGRKGKPGPKYWLGKKHDEEYKKKISLALSGENNPRYGIKMSQHLKNTISIAIKKHYRIHGTDWLKGPRPDISRALMGHKLSEETKRKIGLASAKRTGEKSGRWRGGITPLGRRIRNSDKYVAWVRAVMVRDNFTCRTCSQRGGKLEVHHKIRLSKIIKQSKIKTMKESLSCGQIWNLDNGITYCIKCHSNADRLRKRFITK